MIARRRPSRRPVLGLILLAGLIIWVLAWPARQPVEDTLDQLADIGYQCDRIPDRETVYICTDAAGGDPTDPRTKTTIWLYSPYRLDEAEALMDNYCPHWKLPEQTALIPTAWEVDQRLLIMPHELYSRADLIDHYPARQVQLAADLSQLDHLGPAIDLDTRCQSYQLEPIGGSLI